MKLKIGLLATGSALALFGLALSAHAQTADGPPKDSVSEVVVTAQRLNEARQAIEPSLGASTYTVTNAAIQAQPGGDNQQLNQVVLQLPGVVQDSFGQIHVRDDHNGIQYRINGVILPEGISVFGQTLSPRLVDRLDLITGALPAQYGLQTAGIIDVTTKSGLENGGVASVYGGSHGTYEPSIEYGGHSGNTNFYVSAEFRRTQLGIESPDGSATPDHDRADEGSLFVYVDHILSQSDRISFIGGYSNDRFQIPNTPGLTPQLGLNVNGITNSPSDLLNETQREVTGYAIGSWLHDGGNYTVQTSLFSRYSTLDFRPSEDLGDLLFTGISQNALKRDTAFGLQTEGVYKLTSDHTLRGGVIIQGERATSDTASEVLPVDGVTGLQTSNVPEAILDNGGKTQFTYSVYLQDEWKLLQNLTLNYGLRGDVLNSYRNERQLSPRVNLVWLPTPGTTLHAGYARYFNPPPFELVASPTVAKFQNTTAASTVTQDTVPFAERQNYFDIGGEQKLLERRLTLGVDVWYRKSTNLIDEGQFGAPIILTPFNYAQGLIFGQEFSLNYTQGPFTAYANFTHERAQGKDIESSQFNFSAADLAYIAKNYIYLDHDQTYTGSAGATYLFRDGVISGTRVGFDMLYGSGLRRDQDLPDGGSVPNGAHVASYVTVNLTASHHFEFPMVGHVDVRFDVINVANKTYEIRDGTGVGVGAPQFGASRGFFGGISKTF
ncbi:MAG: TonB-dependent receptor [Caulobacteraceae bacterium]